MTGKTMDITAADGGTFKALVRLPESGSGPAIVLLQAIFGLNQQMHDVAKLYAQEGYVVVVPDLFWRIEPGIDLGYTEEDFGKALGYMGQFDLDKAAEDISATVSAMRAMAEVTGMVGALGFCLGGKLAYLAAARCGVDCSVSYYGVGIEGLLDEAVKVTCPMEFHFAGEDSHVPQEAVATIKAAFSDHGQVAFFDYPGAEHAFSTPGRSSYDKPSSMMAHTCAVALFRRVMGPIYNLVELWEAHVAYEFGARDVDATMATMVESPYVNHIPTMTGGVGYKDLHRFYKNHFIPKTPADTKLIPISRTVGSDRVVDEMLFCFTHDIEIDWMLPGVAPTRRYVEIPLVAIVCFRGNKLYHEHIYWDQASVLVQIGVLDPANLPIAGAETAKKMADETLPSNKLMARWAESAPAGE